MPDTSDKIKAYSNWKLFAEVKCVVPPSEDLINSLIKVVNRKTYRILILTSFQQAVSERGYFNFEWIIRLACQVFQQMINSSYLFLTSSTIPEYDWGFFSPFTLCFRFLCITCAFLQSSVLKQKNKPIIHALEHWLWFTLETAGLTFMH